MSSLNKPIKLSLNSANDALRKFLRRQKLSYFKLAVSKLLSLSFSVLLFFFILSIVDCKLFPVSSVYAEKDSIVLRTIITPIGSQSEKWGAAGLMVCTTGEAINLGGCGLPITGEIISDNGIKVDNREIGTVVFFLDSNNDHQFTDNHGNSPDVVYKIY